MDISYVGERLWVGQLGHLSLLVAFVSAAVSGIAYAKSTNSAQDSPEERSWRNLGRGAFALHGLGVFAAIGLIFYMMLGRFYEYAYAYEHVSDDLPLQYIFSAFWEGQEGSFLLWMFWHVVLGFALMLRSRRWEMPVLAVFALVQACLLTMVMGLYLTAGDARLGSSPFALMREVHLAPIFNDENYLARFKGDGLNPLLQNYWMTIHPPTLFLGFASTLVPFAFAVAGWWRRQYREWLRPVLPWALFSAAVLGLGIAMGGAWAYEALSFGGYWAWDPVENASLVPWLILIAGIHTALVARNTGRSVRSAYWFFVLTFVFIVYSTFLTRSGILGETSVHSFTEMGLEWQLVGFLALCLLLPLGFAWARRRDKAEQAAAEGSGEESAYSREFWIFVGSLVLLLSAALITFTTSIPVFNKVLGTNMAPPEDVVAHHNRYQLWTALLVALLSGTAQFLRYRGSGLSPVFFKYVGVSVLGALALAVLAMLAGGIYAVSYVLLLWAGWFAVLTNTVYALAVLRGRISVSGSALAHVGFGLLLVGVVFSGVLKEAISESFGSDQLTGLLDGLNKQTNKNVLLPRGQAVPIKNGFTALYTERKEEGGAQSYRLEFVRRNAKGDTLERFDTEPYVLFDRLPNGNYKLLSANPNTKRYLTRDVFTLAIPNWAFEDPNADKNKKGWKTHKVQPGDTVFTSRHYVVVEGIDADLPAESEYVYQAGDIPVVLSLSVRTVGSDSFWRAKPLYYIRDSRQFDLPAELPQAGLAFRLSKILPEERKMQLEIFDENEEDYVVMQALVFPGINLVWAGCLLMTAGLLVAARQRMLGA